MEERSNILQMKSSENDNKRTRVDVMTGFESLLQVRVKSELAKFLILHFSKKKIH